MILYKGIHKHYGHSFYYTSKPMFKFGLFNRFLMCKSLNRYLFYKRQPTYTKVINLLEDYVPNIKKNTMYEYRRAKKEGCYSVIISDLNVYSRFFSEFYVEKKRGLENISLEELENISLEELEKNKAIMIIRGGYNKDNELLVTHNYLVDKETRSVILYASSSIIYSGIDNHKREEVGRTNRMLHVEDMEYFKKMGFVNYDMGGYAYDTCDDELIGINNFKDSFSGVLVEMSNYDSWFFIFAYNAKKMLKRILK